jgi:diacylglycerol kinase (ATP)
MDDEGVVFVVNPASANGSTGRRWPEIATRAAAAGLHGATLMSERPGDVATLTERAVADGASVVVVVGGDGTVFEAVNGLVRSGAADGVELAVLSRGTGTDFARSLRLPKEIDEAVDVARSGKARAIDLGRAEYVAWDGTKAEACFANFGGAGISGAIASRANSTSKAMGGRLSFVWATVAVFARWKSTEITVAVDDERRSGRMFEVLVMNGDYTAGGMWAAPEAEPDDGLFDVLLIGDVTKADFVVTFPKIYRGTHLAHPKIESLRGATVTVEAVKPLPIALDGEQPGTTPVTFSIVPRAIRVRVPAPVS